MMLPRSQEELNYTFAESPRGRASTTSEYSILQPATDTEDEDEWYDRWTSVLTGRELRPLRHRSLLDRIWQRQDGVDVDYVRVAKRMMKDNPTIIEQLVLGLQHKVDESTERVELSSVLLDIETVSTEFHLAYRSIWNHEGGNLIYQEAILAISNELRVRLRREVAKRQTWMKKLPIIFLQLLGLTRITNRINAMIREGQDLTQQLTTWRYLMQSWAASVHNRLRMQQETLIIQGEILRRLLNRQTPNYDTYVSENQSRFRQTKERIAPHNNDMTATYVAEARIAEATMMDLGHTTLERPFNENKGDYLKIIEMPQVQISDVDRMHIADQIHDDDYTYFDDLLHKARQ